MKINTESHLEFLHERIFQTRGRWPHFKRMLEDLVALAKSLPDESVVVVLERAYVYGGYSLFAPLFTKQRTLVVDCEVQTAASRHGYQRSWMDDERCVRRPADRRSPITETGLPASCADAVVVPNVVHHERDQEGMFAEIARVLRPGGQGYIFEALLRELHQIPDDYVRYTPWGFREVMSRHGLELTEWRPAGGPFEAIAYCWVQALQYLPETERKDRESWFYENHFWELMDLDKRYKENRVRPHTSFPVAYSVFFQRR